MVAIKPSAVAAASTSEAVFESPARLEEPTRHSEEVDAGYHRHDRSKTDRREGHVHAARHRGEDHRNGDASHERASRNAEAKLAQRDPPQGMGEHAHGNGPREHSERHGEEDTVGCDRYAGRQHILPQGYGPARRIGR